MVIQDKEKNVKIVSFKVGNVTLVHVQHNDNNMMATLVKKWEVQEHSNDCSKCLKMQKPPYIMSVYVLKVRDPKLF